MAAASRGSASTSTRSWPRSTRLRNRATAVHTAPTAPSTAQLFCPDEAGCIPDRGVARLGAGAGGGEARVRSRRLYGGVAAVRTGAREIAKLRPLVLHRAHRVPFESL